MNNNTLVDCNENDTFEKVSIIMMKPPVVVIIKLAKREKQFDSLYSDLTILEFLRKMAII